MKEVKEYLNLFYNVEDDKLVFNGFVVYASSEIRHLYRMFNLDELETNSLLHEWCTEKGMTASGWTASIIYNIKALIQAGYIFAPYVPLQTTEIIVENEDFTPRQSLSSRYTRVEVNPNFYGQINIVDLP